MSIIYEGNELVLHHHQGETDYVVVTFVGAHETKNALSTFFAENVLVKNNITAYGVTVKADFWYVCDEAPVVISLLQERLAPYRNVILIGMSMGGHPALAWSRALGATTVLSMCPKYSLDPNECGILQGYVDNHFRPGMEGMAVRKENVSGRIFIALDPGEGHDAYHVHLIEEELKGFDVSLIKMFFAGHLIIRSLSGTQEFGSVIKALAYGSNADVVETIVRVRLKNRENVSNKFKRYGTLKPFLVFQGLMGTTINKYKKCMGILAEKDTIMPIVGALLRTGRTKEAAKLHYNLAMNISLREKKNSFVCRDLSTPLDGAYIMDFHGRIVCFDVISYNFIFCHSIFDTNDAHFLFSEPEGGFLFIVINGQKLYVCEREGHLSVSESKNASDLQVRQCDDFNYIYYVKTSLGYMISVPGGGMVLDSQNLKSWEMFFCLPKNPEINYCINIKMEDEIVQSNNVGVKTVENELISHSAHMAAPKKSIFAAIFQRK